MSNFQFDSLLVESISLSLLHFVWQACVIASVGAIGYSFLRRSPSGRYLWGVTCFSCFVICPLVTFCWLHPTAMTQSNEPQTELSDVALTQIYPLKLSFDNAFEELNFAQQYQSQKSHLGHLLVVAVWLLGQTLVGSRLLWSSYFVYRLKRIAVPVPTELRNAATRLARKMSVVCPVIASTEQVGGAIAAGFFRQIIVIPTAWLTEMTPEMLKAVIAHELAHLRRHDLWVNLGQRIVEAVFFFHPAVWWLSTKIRHDREVCCDLLAIEATRQRQHYAETLEHVARMESVRTELLATNIGDDRMSLLRRVRWVLGQQPHATSLGWWPAGVLAMVIPCMLFWLSQTGDTLAEPPVIAAEPAKIAPPIPQATPVADEIRVAISPKIEPPQQKVKWSLGEYIIEPPDIVLITSSQEGEPLKGDTEEVIVHGEHLVGADGTVNLGVYGRVFIAGMTTEQAVEVVRKRLAKYMDNPQVAMDIFVYNSKFFYVIVDNSEFGDQVVRVPVTGNETVLDAIAQIGGLDQVSEKKLYIKRPSKNGSSEQTLPIDWEAITRGESAATNYQLLPGDRLFIEPKNPVPTSSSNASVSSVDFAPTPYDLAVQPPPQFPVRDRLVSQPDGTWVRHAPTPARDETVLPSPYYQYDDIQVYPAGPDLVAQDRADKAKNGVLPWRDQEFRHRIPLRGPITSGGKAKLIEAPSDQEILRLVRAGLPKSPLLLPENRDSLSIEKQLVADYTDPAKSYPLIGPAQLHHAHYKCVIRLQTKNTADSTQEPLTFYIDHSHLHVSDDTIVTEPNNQVEPPQEAKRDLYSEVYYVGDLVLPIRNPRFTKSGEQERVTNAKPDFETLINLIESTVAPNSWDEVGSHGSLKSFAGNLSLVITQTQDVHEEIVDLLIQLRRLQESKIVLRATNLKLTKTLMKKLGLGGKDLAALTAKEKVAILTAARRDASARVFAETKATLFNGQFMKMPIDPNRGLMIQAVAWPDKSIRVTAGIVAAAAGSLEQAEASTLERDQSLLVRMPHSSDDEELATFRLIQAELAKPEKEQRVTGTPVTKLGGETVETVQRFPDGFQAF